MPATPRILIFAKAPIAGEVKTRLIPALGAEAAAALHEKLLQRTLTTACRSEAAPIELWCSPGIDHPVFERCRKEFGLTLHPQQGNDLGERMYHAVETALRRASHVIIIGTDCPELGAADLHATIAALSQGEDAVLGPAEDGGYWLLGLRRNHPLVFNDLGWGGADVLEETRTRLRRLNWGWRELATRWDVDRPEDLTRLASDQFFPA